jgi:protein phosphatase
MALPVEADPDLTGPFPLALPVPLDEPVALPADLPLATPYVPPVEEGPAEVAPAQPATIVCSACTSTNPPGAPYCGDCGFYFSDMHSTTQSLPGREGDTNGVDSVPQRSGRLRDRFELQELLVERAGVQRYKGADHATSLAVPVVILRQQLPMAIQPAAESLTTIAEEASDEILPSFDEPAPASFPITEIMAALPEWPSINWERRLLHLLEYPTLPTIVDHFSDESHEYLVLEVPSGQSLWDAWDDPDSDSHTKFGYLVEIAETLQRLHQNNAIVESLRPDDIVVGDHGRIRFTDLAVLLPLPFPTDTSVRNSLYTAPELIAGFGGVDARADLYAFGALLYALHLGRELDARTDFDEASTPKLFSRFPDIHPAFGRLLMKTLCKQVERRFPSDEASKEDATGFSELIRTLEVLRRSYDHVRLDVASWTSTGIIRTGNEDAFAILHAAESRQDDLGEAALVILCDGMGGYEAGEVAAAMTIQTLRQNLTKLAPFNVAAGASPFATDPQAHVSRPQGHAAGPIDVDAVKQAIKLALKEANKIVFQASRAPGSKRRGMGCTAEVVYVDGHTLVVGHVGDSRTYHLHEGRLIQLTRDQTLVNRLVELGTLSPEDAETHPRRNELQQAIGGQPDVEPGLYHGRLSSGDWVIVCSDGLTNHVQSNDLQQMLQSEAASAEMAARRLVNLTLIEGATDNVTVVAIRAT